MHSLSFKIISQP